MLSKHRILRQLKTYHTSNLVANFNVRFMSMTEQNQYKRINRIALLFAMHDEAKPLIERLNMKPSDSYSETMKPFTVFTNNDDTIRLVVNGKCEQYNCDRIGTQWSALSAYLTIHNLAPDIIINAGTCGGVIPKYCFDDIDDAADTLTMDIGDVYIGEKVIYSDRRVPLPPWKIWDEGHFELIGSLYLTEKIKSLKVAKYISSSNAFDYTKEDRATFKKYGVVCKDMECAAIAEMCHQFGCNLIALKGVTDFVEHHDEKDFLQNLIKTVNAVTDHTERVINAIMGKTLSDLSSVS